MFHVKVAREISMGEASAASRTAFLNRITSGVLSLLLLGHVAYYFPRVVDDLFISLRYAENLAHGHGAVFNVGERVEGYSGPSWMLIQAFGILLGFEPVTWTKVVGVSLLFATAFGLRAMAREVYGLGAWVSWIPAFAIAVNPFVVSWTIWGLETPLHLAAIVFAPIAMRRLLAADDTTTTTTTTATTLRRAKILGVIAIVMLGSSRPESALYLIANLGAPFVFVRSRAVLFDLLRRMKPLLIAALILAAALLVRWVYYHDLFPNTYHVKGAHVVFALEKISPLWGRGAPPAEGVAQCGGMLLLVCFAVLPSLIAVKSLEQRAAALSVALSSLFCLYFTASVQEDWMPSLRHLLPALVFAPLGWACLVDWVSRLKALWIWAVMGLLVPNGLYLLSVDYRLSVIERGDRWTYRKKMEKWKDTVMSYRKIPPPHVMRMDSYGMGQITEAWPVMDTSKEPVEESWYAGRDIGAVAFYTGVRVFDTAGLVTRDVSMSVPWTKDGHVTDELVRLMMSKHPVCADLFEDWRRAVGTNPQLTIGVYRILGKTNDPDAIIATDRTAPSHDEIVRRYRAFAGKFPQLYDLHTLYGESVGAAVRRRLEVIERTEARPAP